MGIRELYHFVRICLKASYYEHHGHLSKEEADRICIDYMDKL